MTVLCVLLQLFNSGNPVLKGLMFALDRVATAVLPSWLIVSHNRNVP